jgi:ferredoxin
MRELTLPSSCNAGVCTTCAAQLSQGSVEQGEGMGLSPDLQKEGYALLCVPILARILNWNLARKK